MVDAIIRLTTVLVAVMVVINLAHAALLTVRLALRLRAQDPERWIGLYVPVWRSPREARAWLGAWRRVLGSADPLVVALRADGRSVMLRHAQLFAWAETWAMLVILIAPHAA